MAKVFLQGDLAQFGAEHNFVAYRVGDVMSALCHQIKGFRKRFTNGYFTILYKHKNREKHLLPATLNMLLPPDCELYFTPVADGAKSGGGIGKVLLGVTVLATALVTGGAAAGAYAAAEGAAVVGGAFSSMSAPIIFGITGTQLAGFGAMMILGGIYQCFVKSPSYGNTNTSVAQNASYTFNGPANVTRQGVARPLVFGRFICGSVILSSDMAAERI